MDSVREIRRHPASFRAFLGQVSQVAAVQTDAVIFIGLLPDSRISREDTDGIGNAGF